MMNQFKLGVTNIREYKFGYAAVTAGIISISLSIATFFTLSVTMGLYALAVGVMAIFLGIISVMLEQ